MADQSSVILVINGRKRAASNLKELIEFMDTPLVCTAAPDEWRQRLGDHRLEALFVGPDLSDADVNAIMSGVAQFDPNVPIIMMHASGGG